MTATDYRERTRAQLVAAIARHQHRASRRRRVLAGFLIVLPIAALAVGLGVGLRGGGGSDRAPSQRVAQRPAPASGVQFTLPAVVGERMTLEQAVDKVDFAVRVPDTAAANRDNITGVYTDDDSVQMDFPPPNDHSSDLRQPYLSVWEAPWTEGDPMANYKDDIANDPDAGSKSICSVNDLPALCVEARSPADETQQNAAFLRVIIDKVEVEVSGGDSVETLIDVASSLEKASSTSASGSE